MSTVTDYVSIVGELASLSRPPEESRRMASEIHQQLLAQSPRLAVANFFMIGVADLELLYALYDERFFRGRLQVILDRADGAHLSFRLSRRMTRSGGTTSKRTLVVPGSEGARKVESYEIAISTTLLFQSFKDPSRPVRVNGVACGDRLDALQRVFEHELVHLFELLAWKQSNCTQPRFRGLAWSWFAHTGTTHDLVTQREAAWSQYKVKVGDWVMFDWENDKKVGVVNRITQRATVLVEDPSGQRYTDGRCYNKFYVPLRLLKRVET
jgi:hypothetical protein